MNKKSYNCRDCIYYNNPLESCCAPIYEPWEEIFECENYQKIKEENLNDNI